MLAPSIILYIMIYGQVAPSACITCSAVFKSMCHICPEIGPDKFFFLWCRLFFFSPTFILEYLQRGMLRPGLLELLAHMRSVGATIVVYTHSEEKWCVCACVCACVRACVRVSSAKKKNEAQTQKHTDTDRCHLSSGGI
jgi:hypothetical protein